MERQKQIKDLCGNEYLIKETPDIYGGKVLEVYEIVDVEGKKMSSYLFEIEGRFDDDTNTLLDEIDDTKATALND